MGEDRAGELRVRHHREDLQQSIDPRTLDYTLGRFG